MKTKAEWDQNITNITTRIHQEFPELTKYINEMPVKVSGEGEINVKNLEDYYHSLEGLVNKYAKTHVGAIANEGEESLNEKGFKDDMSGDDLDIPGSELDDQQESVGSEDEENNYYSLGGDNHSDLEENQG
ncbi:MAG: hypothetical protein SH848_08290 [Saprospiraceae bacterium]|nr:hypothetical protein [Saprospiraceae bacterium]MDZ4703914.1 hypothetical protein [Saprospiraceae bacterium]